MEATTPVTLRSLRSAPEGGAVAVSAGLVDLEALSRPAARVKKEVDHER
jgi:hypothetical protein